MPFTLTPLAPPPDLASRLPTDLSPALAAALAHAWTHAPFLRGLLRGGDRLDRLLAGGPADLAAAAIAAARAAADDPANDPGARLRAARADLALAVALADLTGDWSLEAVTLALSDFADAAIDAAIAAALAERGAPNAGFVALALGKLGSRELNYSSDVDLILLYEPALVPCRPREEPAEAAVRIARRMVALLSEQRPDGYVARVDLRLRPASEVTPMAISLAAAEHYYQSEALTWERVAFIRARACAGDLARGDAFLAAIRPFVWRRSLDYTAIRDIQSVSLRIRDHFEAGQALGPGYDLKRGRGGIREVEFFAQIHQLIWGGREPALRAPATLDGLAALAAATRIGADDAAELGRAYRLLRTVEHRLQMRGDEQTHAIPRAAKDRAALAALCGMDWRALERRLGAATRMVARRYDGLIAEAGGAPADRLPVEPKALKAALATHGKPAAEALAPLVARWRGGTVRALRADESRAAFDAILPAFAAALGKSPDPARAAARADTFLAQLPAGLQFFALLAANPRLVDLLATLLGTSPALADALARQPALFDGLLGRDAFAALPDDAALDAELAAAIAGETAPEAVLDRVRRWTGERRFQLGAQLVAGDADPLRVGRDLARLADAALRLLADRVADDFAQGHGRVPGGGLVVLALGRYGGGLLTHASDLDLVYLFTGTHDAVSDGPKPLAATLYFNRLATRLTAALSVPTAAGALYEVDTRLRPSGAKGLLAVTVESFGRYQRDEAETWEHMALTRARIVAGEPAEAQTVIAEVLATPREPGKLRSAILAMRAEMALAKPGQGVLDVKLAPGGLVDLEFVTHFLQLRDRIACTPDLAAAVAALVAAGRLDPAVAQAHDALTRTLILQRLLGDDPGARLARDDAAAAIGLAKRAVLGAWEAAFDEPRRGR